MPNRTPAEWALARSYATGGADDETTFQVEDLSVEYHADRTLTLTYLLTVKQSDRHDERWVFTLPWGEKSFLDVFTSPSPDAERLKQLVHLVRAQVDEWWYTKDSNRHSAKMARRIHD